MKMVRLNFVFGVLVRLIELIININDDYYYIRPLVARIGEQNII